ncbi:hypothetical protein [Sulfuriflexus mobilis]|uniref:hypothetical protein n=1 Tax=Sulfuriflexus mobilis TaxID=1811807 RepID=UPI000F81DF9D|nr:hypothetical protein [Sulfuriflexus mobilis]
MMKRTLFSVFVIFIVWSILDFVIHGVFLQSTYEATAHLWRPMEEMNMPLMYFVTLAYTACFVVIYGVFVTEKSLSTGIKFGGLFGLAAGIMGFGSYSYMPIPLSLAWSWFAGILVELIVAGALVGTIMKPEGKSS